MKTISDYTIYCTPEQTKKALELGAPLYKLSMSVDDSHLRDKSIRIDEKDELIDYAIPTADQMIGWLEGVELIKEICVSTVYADNGDWYYCIYSKKGICLKSSIKKDKKIFYSSRKEATLAAIDAALKYCHENNII